MLGGLRGVKPQGAQANSLASVINLRGGLRLESRAHPLSDIVGWFGENILLSFLNTV